MLPTEKRTGIIPDSIDVIVPVFGNWKVTASCLRHLQNQSVPHRVILVDDASPDDTLEMVRRDYPLVDVVEMVHNSGFARACNKGISCGSGEFVILLNNDVDADPEMISRLIEPFKSDESIGSTVPLLLGLDGTVDSFGISADKSLAGFVRHHGAIPELASTTDPPILGPYGAAAAYRRTALQQVGLLDERIFMYGEELDLALRLRNGGWGVAAVPTAQGVHVGGASTGKGSARQRYLAGFGRGYIIRVYGLLHSRVWFRTLATELIVAISRLIISRDAESLKGRIAGWNAGRDIPRRTQPIDGVSSSISFLESLKMRGPRYWSRTTKTKRTQY